ncbi:MAG TPA: hypothetical protein VN836_06905, partial [Verrucomicrobiae bacterium]|nr:hypothetical protein [Verrucomicrobiae bacterium]
MASHETSPVVSQDFQFGFGLANQVFRPRNTCEFRLRREMTIHANRKTMDGQGISGSGHRWHNPSEARRHEMSYLFFACFVSVENSVRGKDFPGNNA